MQATCQHMMHNCHAPINPSPRHAAPGTVHVRTVRGNTAIQNQRCTRLRASDEEQRLQEMAQQAQQDPQMKAQVEQMQKMMSDPNAQAQMQQQMAAAMQSPEVQKRMAALQEDPEIMEVLNKAKSGGLGSMMQLMQDQSFMEKVGRKMGGGMGGGGGGNPLAAAAAAPPVAAAAPPAEALPDIENLLDAAKHGDLEATEDLIAVKKDIDQRDADQRTPLHYAVAYNHPDIMHQLLDAGANLEAKDSKGNTPLHYAAGYGRIDIIEPLLEAGCSGRAANSKGHTPYELVKMDANNPIQSEPNVVQALEKAAA